MRLPSTESTLVLFLIFETAAAFATLFFGGFFLFILPCDDLQIGDWILTFLVSKALAVVLLLMPYAFFRLARLDYVLWVENY